MKKMTFVSAFLFVVLCLCSSTALAMASKKPLSSMPHTRDINWLRLSSRQSHLEAPNTGDQQTASLVLDIDKDGITDFVITERTSTPSVVWYKFNGRGWDRYIIDNSPLRIEAGGDFHDIDGDGDLDVCFCGDWLSDGLWWWENPYPNYNRSTSWKRRTIKAGDNAKYQHDNAFGDFDGDGKVELAWWSQTARKLFLAEIPSNPKNVEQWQYSPIFSYSSPICHTGLVSADINLDGRDDLVGAGYWFEHTGGDNFFPHRITNRFFSRTAVGQLVTGGRPEVVVSPGDVTGSLDWFQWNNSAWTRHILKDKLDHSHSCYLADFDADGNLDIFCAEMRLNNSNPDSKMWIFFGDGTGRFTEKIIARGYGNHESRPADLDGDGDVDILGKPYNWDAPRIDVWLNNGTGPNTSVKKNYPTTIQDPALGCDRKTSTPEVK